MLIFILRKLIIPTQSLFSLSKVQMRSDPNLSQDLQGVLQLCALLYFEHLQLKHSGGGGWHKAWTNIFTMQTSEPQIAYYLIIGFLRVLLAPKGHLLTAQLSPLTLIKVLLGSWSWWIWRTLKFGVFLKSAFLTRWSVPENPETYELSSTFCKILLSTRLTEDGGIPQIPK